MFIKLESNNTQSEIGLEYTQDCVFVVRYTAKRVNNNVNVGSLYDTYNNTTRTEEVIDILSFTDVQGVSDSEINEMYM
jgi:hypothetical protein